MSLTMYYNVCLGVVYALLLLSTCRRCGVVHVVGIGTVCNYVLHWLVVHVVGVVHALLLFWYRL